MITTRKPVLEPLDFDSLPRVFSRLVNVPKLRIYDFAPCFPSTARNHFFTIHLETRDSREGEEETSRYSSRKCRFSWVGSRLYAFRTTVDLPLSSAIVQYWLPVLGL
jgi:hypothetical protein